MNYLSRLPDDLVIMTSGHQFKVALSEYSARLIAIAPDTQNPARWNEWLEYVQDEAKSRYWLAVSKDLIRQRRSGKYPDSLLLSHFDVDDMSPNRLPELHGFKILESIFDGALSSGKRLDLVLEAVQPPPNWHVTGIGTLKLPEDARRVRLLVTGLGEGLLSVDGRDFQIRSGKVAPDPAISPDQTIETPFGSLRVTANIKGIGEAYHGNAAILRSCRAIQQWALTLKSAVTLLAEIDPELARGCVRLSRDVCPLYSDGISIGSASPQSMLGMVFLPGVADPYDVAECLLHETLHQKLYRAELTSKLFLGLNGDTERYYSPWRSDPRPLRMLVHGAFVFSGVAQMWYSIQQSSASDEISHRAKTSAYLRYRQSRMAMEIVRKFGEPTAFGEKILSLIDDELDSLVVTRDNSTVATIEHQISKHLEDHGMYEH